MSAEPPANLIHPGQVAHGGAIAAVWIFAMMLMGMCLLPPASRSQPVNDPYRSPAAIEEIRRVRDLLFDGQYDQVVPECRRAEQEFPYLLVWRFAAMLVPQARMLELHNWDLTNEYQNEWNELLNLSEKIKQQRPYSAYDYLCLGGGYGIVGLHSARGHDYRKAFEIGVKAISVLNKTLETDPTCNDAYLGYGIYHYYRGALSERIKWLPFFSNDRRVGLKELDKARQGIFGRPLADLAQVYLYKDEGKWKEAIAITKDLRKQYPHGLLLPQLIGFFHLNLREFDIALPYFDLVLKSDPKNGPVHLFRGICLFYTGKVDEAAQECEKCIAFGSTNDYQAPAYFCLGEVDWKNEKYDDARANWKKAEQLDPQFQEPRKALERPVPQAAPKK